MVANQCTARPSPPQEPEAIKKREQDRLMFVGAKGRPVPPEEQGDFVRMCAACVDRMAEQLGKSVGRCGGPFPTAWTPVTKGVGLDALRAAMIREHQAAHPAAEEEAHAWTAEEEAAYYASAEAHYAEYGGYAEGEAEAEAEAEGYWPEEAEAPAAEDAAEAPTAAEDAAADEATAVEEENTAEAEQATTTEEPAPDQEEAPAIE